MGGWNLRLTPASELMRPGQKLPACGCYAEDFRLQLWRKVKPDFGTWPGKACPVVDFSLPETGLWRSDHDA